MRVLIILMSLLAGNASAEPGTALLMGLRLMGLAARKRRNVLAAGVAVAGVMLAGSASALLVSKPYGIDYHASEMGFQLDTEASYFSMDVDPDPFEGGVFEVRTPGENWDYRIDLTYLDSTAGIDRYELQVNGFLDYISLEMDPTDGGQGDIETWFENIQLNLTGIVYQSADTSQRVVMEGTIPLPPTFDDSLTFNRDRTPGCNADTFCRVTFDLTEASDLRWRTVSTSTEMRLAFDLVYEVDDPERQEYDYRGDFYFTVPAMQGRIEGTAVAYTPEPSTALMMGLGLMGFAMRKRGA